MGPRILMLGWELPPYNSGGLGVACLGLAKALADNVNRFETQHGEIKDYDQPPIPMNFGPTGQA